MPSTVADHITPVRLGGDFWDINNLQGLCASCHNSKSAKEGKAL
jgi:5-methylcytosine-specific restriction enzyme A